MIKRKKRTTRIKRRTRTRIYRGGAKATPKATPATPKATPAASKADKAAAPATP